MKLTELKCGACGGSVKADPEKPGIVECEYCHSRFIVESEQGMTPLYRNPVPYSPLNQPERKEDGEFRWWQGILIALLLAVAAAVMFGPQLYQKYQENQVLKGQGDVKNTANYAGGKEKQEVTTGASTVSVDPLISAFCEAVFSKPAEELTESERSEIKWLEFGSDLDHWKIGYSSESPTDNKEAQLTWLTFPRDRFQKADLSCLPFFPELSFIGTRQTIDVGDLSGLGITGIRGSYHSLDQVAELVDNPAAVTWVELTGDPISLSGIEKFPDLETLVLDGAPEDEKLLVQASKLKALTLDLYDENIDFAVVSMIPELERLIISCKNLWDISFAAKMENLKVLHLENGAMISVEPLRNCMKLTELTIEDCDEIKDLSPVSGLSGLKKLSLDLPYQCPEPDLSLLTQIKELRLSGFEMAGFLSDMTKMEALTLDSCRIRDPEVFSGLTSLKYLSCTSFGAAQFDYSFIENMKGLESVDLSGTETYDDLSWIFNLPALRSLNLSGMSCEIDFDRIAENTCLKELSMDHIKLYKNVEVSGGNGIYSVNWDDVSLAENLSFLGKCKGLEKLSIKENELTDLSFATKLPALKMIDFSDNYVTDVGPLSGLKNLKTVIGMENPVTNYEVLRDSVVVSE